MSVKKLISSYAAFNLSANQQFVNWLKSQPEELLHKEIPSSFKGVLHTLNHIWAAEEVWCADLFKNDDVVNRYYIHELNAQEVFEGLLNRSEKILEQVNQLSEEDFDTSMNIEKPWYKAKLTLAEYLQHTFNHGTYHRGQIITMGHTLGFKEMPSTDFLFYSIMKEG